MPQFSELVSYATALVNDEDRAAHAISFKYLINQGVNEIAGGMQSTLGSWITPPLPDLFKIDTVSTATDAAFVSMPSDYHRNLQLAVRATGQEVDIAHSFIDFTETYPLLDTSGIISEVVEFGGNLYYQGIPTSSEDITLHYFRLPVDMVEDEDEPDGIPVHLQIPLLVNYAVWKSHEFIEDGMEGETPNTDKYMGFFLTALRTLELSIPADTRGIMLR